MLARVYNRGKDLSLKARSLWLRYPLRSQDNTKKFPPFFIMGSGRSGTTVLRKLLQQNPQVIIPPESGDLLRKSIKAYIKFNSNSWTRLVDDIVKMWEDNSEFKYWGIEGRIPRDSLKHLPGPKRTLESIINHIYFIYACQHKPLATMWGDKTPYATYGLPWIRKLYPDGYVIHMLRDGRDVISSCLKHNICKSVQEASARWNQTVDILSKQHSNMKLITVRYEDLVSDTQSQLRRLEQFLNLDHGHYREYLTNNPNDIYLGDDHFLHHANLSRPIFTESIGSWKNALSTREIELMTRLISPNLKKLGYA